MSVYDRFVTILVLGSNYGMSSILPKYSGKAIVLGIVGKTYKKTPQLFTVS